MLARSAESHRPAEAELTELMAIAYELRGLPRPDFRASLKAGLERRIGVSSTVQPVAAKYFREGFHSITPYLVVSGAAALMDFAKQAFGAQELMRVPRPGAGAGIMHAEFQIADSIVEVADATAQWQPLRAAIHLYVPDADAVYQRAVRAGAASLSAPVDQPYGDREAGVEDQWGNHWFIATHQGPRPLPEGLRSVTPYLHARGAADMIAFLRQAFQAEELVAHRSPEGTIVHAKMRIGDSVVELGEAHGQWQPRPAMLHLYVPDTDAVYERALEAGATSLVEPADQPYGDRMGAVTDPFGYCWAIATHIRDVHM